MTSSRRLIWLKLLLLSGAMLVGCSDSTSNTPSNDSPSPLFNGFYRTGISTEFFETDVLRTSVISFDAQRNRITEQRTGTDGFNSPIEEELDSQGRLETRTLFSSNGSIDRVTRYRYGDNGLPIDETQENPDGSSRRQTMTWNEDNQIIGIERIDMDTAGVITARDQFTYIYDGGTLRSLIGEDIQNQTGVFSEFAFQVDEDGNILLRDEFALPSREVLERVVNQYDENGNLMTRSLFDATGALVWQRTETYEPSPQPIYNARRFTNTVYP